jgi:hypothetical protein
MQKKEPKNQRSIRSVNSVASRELIRWAHVFAIGLVAAVPIAGLSADTSDPVLNLLLQKGIITEGEAQKAQAEAEVQV